MKGVRARVTRGLSHGSLVLACDNSGARIMKIVSVKGYKGVKGRCPSAGIGDYVMCSVVEGRPDMRKQVVAAVIVRQRRAYRRRGGERVSFDDNAAVVLKDELGSPKGTTIKGPIAQEVSERWPMIGKIANVVV